MASRRMFLETGVLAATAAGLARRVVAAPSDRVRVGFIGVGNRGDQLLDAFALPAGRRGRGPLRRLRALPEAGLRGDPPALPGDGPDSPDEDDRRRLRRPRAGLPRLLDRKDIDAVCHRHARPLARRSRRSSPATPARTSTSRSRSRSPSTRGAGWSRPPERNKRVVQVGTHRRSSASTRELAELVRAGAHRQGDGGPRLPRSNMSPHGIGREKPERPAARARLGHVARAPGLAGPTRTTSHPTSSAGGSSTRRRWATGACTTSTSSAG